MLTLDDIRRALARIRPHIPPTPLESAPDLGGHIWLKLENTNRTHSFKVRGALNAVLSLDEAARARGLVAASSGNHAQALAYAAQLVGAKAHIFMPASTPQKKVKGVQRYQATADLSQPNFDMAEAAARQQALDSGQTYISAYNDPNVIAGAGTIGLELLDALPHIARVVVCAGGGGLISGIALALKTASAHAVEVVGVCAEHAPALYNAFYNAHLPERWDTLAEALSGGIEADSITVALARQYVDRVLLVTEAQIAAAIRWMLDVQGWLVEGGGAVGVAAMLHSLLPDDGRPTAIIISGSNIDGTRLRQLLGAQPA